MKRLLTHILIWLVLLPPAIAAAATTQEGSLLREGRWVKVKVGMTGVHRLSAEWLKAQGFDDPQQVIVAGYGSVERAHTLDSAPDDLPILPVRRTHGGINFMAEGDIRVIPSAESLTVHRNNYSRGSYYYIGVRDGYVSPEIPVADSKQGDGEAVERNHVGQHLTADHHDFIEMRPYEHGLFSFSKNFADSSYTVSFSHEDAADTTGCVFFLPAWYATKDGTTLTAHLPAGAKVADGATNEFTFKRNNVTSNTIYSVASHTMPVEIEKGMDSLRVKFAQSSPAVAELLALRTASLVYPRLNRGADATRLLHFTKLKVTDCVDFSRLPQRGAEVWDVSEVRSPRRLTLSIHPDDPSIASVTPEKLGRCTLVAFDPEKAPEPELVGGVKCQSLREMEDVDMLIVATPVTVEAAERLAEAHRNLQGLKVSVALQEQVMNEFSSGAIHPNGLRAMVKMLHQRKRPLRYLMLMGRGSSDTRRDFDRSPFESLVTYATEDYTENGNENKCHTSDYYFGITAAGKIGPSLATTLMKADVSVGRIPVDNLADANKYVDKCIDYLSDPHRAGTINHMLMAACYGDKASHILSAEDVAVNTFSRLMPGGTVSRSYMDLFPLESTNVSAGTRTHFKNNLAIGPRIMAYIGHGESNVFLLSCYENPDVATTSFGSLPVCILACCLTTDINLDRTSIGELLLTAKPGPVSVIAPGTSVFLSSNVNFLRRLTEMLCTPGTEGIGDAYRLAVNSFMVRNGSYQTTNNLCYNFTGDPALPSLIPTRTVSLNSLNGKAYAGDTTMCSPGERLALAGTIVTAEGEVDTDFNGSLYVDLFDGAVSRKSLNHEQSAEHNNDYYTLDETIAGRYATEVKDGHWEINLTAPATMHRAAANRLSFNAYTPGFVTASSALSPIVIDPAALPTADGPVDSHGPEIEILIGGADFEMGECVGPSPLLTLTLTDTVSGVSLGQTIPGAAPSVRLDGQLLDRVSRIFTPGSNGTASATYELTDIADGRHELAVSATDLAGNRSYRSVSFTVSSSLRSELSASTTIARREVTFDLSHSLAVAEGTTPEVSRLMIRDLQDNPVRTVEYPVYPYTWNLLDDDALPVANGTYRVSAIAGCAPMFTSTPEITITVIHSLD